MPESASSPELTGLAAGGESLAGLAIPASDSLPGFAAPAAESAVPSAVGSAFAANESDGQGAVCAPEPSGAGFSAFGSAESAAPGEAARTVSSAAAEVTAGDFMGLGKVTADSFASPAADLPGAASAGASSADDGLPTPLPGLGDGSFGLVGREAARRAAEAGGGVAPEADDLPEVDEDDLPEADDSDRVLSRRCELSALFDEEPRASATVRSEDLSLLSGVSPFLLSDSGLGSTLFRTTVSG